ncbi:MAG: AAA family ATPase [Candidatus Eisenbacteria bacterium]|nr:AAA family ATPase [Candidatus Eisenbacteria bacterium]
MRSIAVVNQKGGCGKTTTAINLASCLADSGKRVLLLDGDPQSHASIGLGIDTESLDRSMYDLLMNPDSHVTSLVHRVSERLDVVPSSVVLSAVEQQLSGRPDRENRLRWKVEACSADYDYCIVDCPPSVGLLTFNALVACNEAFVIMEPSYFSLHGALKVIDTIKLVRDQLGMRKQVRVLLTMFDGRTRFANDFVREARGRFGREMFETVIRQSVRFKEASNWGMPVGHFSRSATGARDYRALAEEVIAGEERAAAGGSDEMPQMRETGLEPGMDEWILAQPGPHFVEGGVLFSLVAPEANEVRLVGSFNDWDREHGFPLTRNANGVWHATLDLAPGRHLYKFIIDGVWRPDPANESRAAPNDDCVVEVYRKD